MFNNNKITLINRCTFRRGNAPHPERISFRVVSHRNEGHMESKQPRRTKEGTYIVRLVFLFSQLNGP